MLASVHSVVALNHDISIEAEMTVLASHSSEKDIIVLDGYHFNGPYQQALKAKTKAAIVCIDDIHKGYYHADAVINHIGGITIDDYESVATTVFFLGIAYALVNKVFIETRPQWKDERNLLICLGGSDPGNNTMKLLEALPERRFDSITVIVGNGYQYKSQLEKYIAGKNIRLYQHLKPEEVAKVMAGCRYAILSPSTVSYEYLHIGGIAYLYQIADNQQRVKDFFLTHKLALDFEQINDTGVSEDEFLENQQRFFDRRSHDRLFRLFDGLSLMKQAMVRSVTNEDIDIVFKWVNDPLTRAMSYSDQPIEYANHVKWFGNRINDASNPYFIFEKDGKAIAQIRFDVKEEIAVLSYLIGEEQRGKSLGTWILAEGIRQLKQKVSTVKTVVGYVKETNIASCKSFEKLRFHKEKAGQYPASFKYSMEI